MAERREQHESEQQKKVRATTPAQWAMQINQCGVSVAGAGVFIIVDRTMVLASSLLEGIGIGQRGRVTKDVALSKAEEWLTRGNEKTQRRGELCEPNPDNLFFDR